MKLKQKTPDKSSCYISTLSYIKEFLVKKNINSLLVMLKDFACQQTNPCRLFFCIRENDRWPDSDVPMYVNRWTLFLDYDIFTEEFRQ